MFKINSEPPGQDEVVGQFLQAVEVLGFVKLYFPNSHLVQLKNVMEKHKKFITY